MFKFLSKKDTLLLALITGISYCTAYFYEYGYAKYFNYPEELISISVMTLIKTGLTLFMFLFVLTAIINLISKRFDPKSPIGSIITNLLSFFSLGLVICFILYLVGDPSLKYYSLILMFFIVMILVCSFPFKNRKDGILKEMNKRIEKSIKNNEINETKKDVLTDFISSCIILIILAFIITAMGTYIARTQISFYSFEKNNVKYAVVNKYDDFFITKIINKENKFEDGVFIFNINDASELEVKKIKIKE
ncbi:hypothetical protein I4674_15525 [Proteus mirabilis]|nr:hypothetical protein [Proteus mirabilis]